MGESLTDFLRARAAKYDAEAKAKEVVIDEFRAALLRLYDQIKCWLKESDPDGIIEIKQFDWDVREPAKGGLGVYKAPRMDLHCFGKWIGFVPKARKTIGTAIPAQKSVPERATGRVDITDELTRYVLYRVPHDDADSWCVYYPATSEQKPFDKQHFERILMSYFG